MARHFVFGNGNILVCQDEHGQIRDFYYPYVGQENHVAGKAHKLGFLVDSSFSWFDSPQWKKKLSYKKESLVSNITATQQKLGLKVEMQDTVHYNRNIFLRKIVVHNETDREREAKIFCNQSFCISETTVGETAYYDPLTESIIHYKGKRYFLINGYSDGEKRRGIANYATGLAGEYGLQGTYKDAEDGKLSNNPIEHGLVDSTISFDFVLPPRAHKTVYYWICVGENKKEIGDLNAFVVEKSPEKLINEADKHWVKWANKTKFIFLGLSDGVIDLFKRSLLVINAHVDSGGSIIASSDSEMLFLKRDVYAYMWPRDGALITRSLDRAQYRNITERFFHFCKKVLTPEGYLFHKYKPDGSLGSSWHSWLKEGKVQLPIQEDQIALVLDALWKHFVQHGDKTYVGSIFKSFIRKIAEFLCKFVDKGTGLPNESYDLWEEKLGIHTFTCTTVYAGLKAAANFENIFGSETRAQKYLKVAEQIKKKILQYMYDPEKKVFIKGIYYEGDEIKRDNTIDASSIYGIFEYGILPSSDERVQASIKTWLKTLRVNTPIGGYARYENDSYYRVSKKVPGNPWFIISLWLAEYYISMATTQEELKPAIEIFEWVTNHTLETGILAEQLDPHSGNPLSVAPLTWSHAGFVIAINKYLEKLDSIGVCEMCNPPQVDEKELEKTFESNNKKS